MKHNAPVASKDVRETLLHNNGGCLNMLVDDETKGCSVVMEINGGRIETLHLGGVSKRGIQDGGPRVKSAHHDATVSHNYYAANEVVAAAPSGRNDDGMNFGGNGQVVGAYAENHRHGSGVLDVTDDPAATYSVIAENGRDAGPNFHSTLQPNKVKDIVYSNAGVNYQAADRIPSGSNDIHYFEYDQAFPHRPDQKYPSGEMHARASPAEFRTGLHSLANPDTFRAPKGGAKQKTRYR